MVVARMVDLALVCMNVVGVVVVFVEVQVGGIVEREMERAALWKWWKIQNTACYVHTTTSLFG